jgi:hypothetical protein
MTGRCRDEPLERVSRGVEGFCYPIPVRVTRAGLDVVEPPVGPEVMQHILGWLERGSVTDGRPDRRPDVRESEAILGNFIADFDFSQSPRPPMVLPVHPSTTLTARAG